MAQFEDIVIVDLDVQKTTWSRVHSAMRTLYLRLNRDPDIAWTKFFFEERNSRVELKRHGLWIEEGYIVFDCLLIDVDEHHLPDIRRSIAFANERSHELLLSQREERERNKAKARDEADLLKALRANIRDDRREEAVSDAEHLPEHAPEPDTAASLEEAAHSQLVVPPLTLAPPLESLAQTAAEPTVPPAAAEAESATTAEPASAEPEVPHTEASETDLEFKRSDWRARFRAAFERNKN